MVTWNINHVSKVIPFENLTRVEVWEGLTFLCFDSLNVSINFRLFFIRSRVSQIYTLKTFKLRQKGIYTSYLLLSWQVLKKWFVFIEIITEKIGIIILLYCVLSWITLRNCHIELWYIFPKELWLVVLKESVILS